MSADREDSPIDMRPRPRGTAGRLLVGAMAVASIALVAVLGAGCPGGSDSGGGATAVVHMGDAIHEPLELGPLDPGSKAAADPVTAAHLKPTRAIEPWQVVSQVIEFMPKVPVTNDPASPRRPALVLRDRKEAKQISIPVSIRAEEVNEVLLGLRLYNRDTVQVFLKSEGRPVAVSQGVSVAASQNTVAFPFPGLRRKVGTEIDEVLVRVDSDARTFVLFDVILRQLPVSSFVPTVEPELVSIRPDNEEARRGLAVSTRRPLAGEFIVGPNMELAFSYGIPEVLRLEPQGKGGKGKGRAVLQLELAAADDEEVLVSERFPLEKSGSARSTWHRASVDLSAYEDQRLVAVFRLEVDSPLEGFCIVSEARLLSRGTAAPTVLLITSDTHRADHLGTAGELVVTPTLDALAARGVVFENCYSATNVTNPSHVSIMTAINPRDTRIVNNRSPLVDGATTLAEGFRDGGYRTFAALSAHHLMHSDSGLGQGFDRMSAPRQADRDSSITLDILEDWVREAEGEPLFVWLHVFDAHSPYEPPAPYSGRYWEKDRDPHDPDLELDLPERLVPPFLRGLRDVDFPYSQYRGEVDYLDGQLARVLEHERFRDAVVAFTADHGESFGQHGVYWDHAELYPDTVHIPLILAWPGSPAGERVTSPVSSLDVGRTLLDLAGLEEAPLGGRDLRHTLDGSFQEEPRFLMSAHGFSAAINSGGWHLILHLRKHHQSAVRDPRSEHQVELYDLRSDPGCENDLVEEEFERARRMRERLVRWLMEAQDLGLKGTGVQTREGNEQLEALGYGGGQEVEAGAWFDPEHDRDDEKPCEWCERFR